MDRVGGDRDARRRLAAEAVETRSRIVGGRRDPGGCDRRGSWREVPASIGCGPRLQAVVAGSMWRCSPFVIGVSRCRRMDGASCWSESRQASEACIGGRLTARTSNRWRIQDEALFPVFLAGRTVARVLRPRQASQTLNRDGSVQQSPRSGILAASRVGARTVTYCSAVTAKAQRTEYDASLPRAVQSRCCRARIWRRRRR